MKAFPPPVAEVKAFHPPTPSIQREVVDQCEVYNPNVEDMQLHDIGDVKASENIKRLLKTADDTPTTLLADAYHCTATHWPNGIWPHDAHGLDVPGNLKVMFSPPGNRKAPPWPDRLEKVPPLSAHRKAPPWPDGLEKVPPLSAHRKAPPWPDGMVTTLGHHSLFLTPVYTTKQLQVILSTTRYLQLTMVLCPNPYWYHGSPC